MRRWRVPSKDTLNKVKLYWHLLFWTNIHFSFIQVQTQLLFECKDFLSTRGLIMMKNRTLLLKDWIFSFVGLRSSSTFCASFALPPYSPKCECAQFSPSPCCPIARLIFLSLVLSELFPLSHNTWRRGLTRQMFKCVSHVMAWHRPVCFWAGEVESLIFSPHLCFIQTLFPNALTSALYF